MKKRLKPQQNSEKCIKIPIPDIATLSSVDFSLKNAAIVTATVVGGVLLYQNLSSLCSGTSVPLSGKKNIKVLLNTIKGGTELATSKILNVMNKC